MSGKIKFKQQSENLDGSENTLYSIILLFKKHFITFTLVVICIGVALCTRSYRQNKDYIAVSIAYNYENAAKGLLPNNTRFNMYEIESEQVMEKAIEYADLEGITPEELSDCISVFPRGKSSIGKEYISTEYMVHFNPPPGLLQIDSESLLRLICKAYSDVFYSRYTDNSGALRFDFTNIDEYDYLESSDIIDLKAKSLDRYISERIAKNSTYRSPNTGMTFKDIREHVNNLRNVDIEKFDAFIIQSKTAKNISRLISKLSCQNYLNDVQLQKRMAEYSVRIDRINNYDAVQSASVMIPTEDTKREFYMSKTKTGTDYLALQAQEWATKVTSLQLKISETDLLIDKIDDTTQGMANIYASRANKMIFDMNNTMNDITDLVLKTDNDYIKYAMENYLTFSYARTGILQKIEFTSAFLICGAIYIMLWLIAWLRRKGERKGRHI